MQEQKPVNRDICEGKESGRRNDVWLCWCFPWMFQSFETLTGVPITSPSRVTPLRPSTIEAPLLDMHVLRITPYTQSQTPYCLFFVKFCFHFIYFPMFFLCYLCETSSVVDLFLSETAKTTEFKVCYIELQLRVQAIIWNDISHNV